MKIDFAFERFWDKVKILGPDECWEWQASTDSHGYGCFGIGIGSRKIEKSSRVAWMHCKGPIPKGLHVLHDCDNPPCCNPKHLFLGTQSDNMTDCSKKGRLRIPHYKGSKNPASKLTEESVSNIKAKLRLGFTLRKLAQEYRVHITAISHIKQGRNWSHIQ